jgi:hypothetical protein
MGSFTVLAEVEIVSAFNLGSDLHSKISGILNSYLEAAGQPAHNGRRFG